MSRPLVLLGAGPLAHAAPPADSTALASGKRAPQTETDPKQEAMKTG